MRTKNDYEIVFKQRDKPSKKNFFHFSVSSNKYIPCLKLHLKEVNILLKERGQYSPYYRHDSDQHY